MAPSTDGGEGERPDTKIGELVNDFSFLSDPWRFVFITRASSSIDTEVRSTLDTLTAVAAIHRCACNNVISAFNIAYTVSDFYYYSRRLMPQYCWCQRRNRPMKCMQIAVAYPTGNCFHQDFFWARRGNINFFYSERMICGTMYSSFDFHIFSPFFCTRLMKHLFKAYKKNRVDVNINLPFHCQLS